MATSTLYNNSVSTSSSYTVYSPFSNYTSSTEGTISTYFTLNGQLVGTYTYQVGNEAATGKVTYILSNYENTPTLETDDKGDIVEANMTDVFGNYVYRDTRKDAALHTKAFTGQEYDETTQLSYFHARYLATPVHSFLSVDPLNYNIPQEYLLDPQQLNTYSYARNNPVTLVDRDGQKVAEYQQYSAPGTDYVNKDLVGTYRGLSVRSRGPKISAWDSKYQCTDLSVSFISNQYNISLPTVMAVNYGNQKLLNSSAVNSSTNSSSFIFSSNGSTKMPQENDLITWAQSPNDKVGHTGFIAEVVFDSKNNKGTVWTIEQNFGYQSGIFQNDFTYEPKTGGYIIKARPGSTETYYVQGWTTYANQSKLLVYSQTSPALKASIQPSTIIPKKK